MLLATLTSLVCLVTLGGAYEHCTSDKDNFDGYTHVPHPVTGERVWSHCAFFRPHNDHALCGRVPRSDYEYHMCDPDNLLANISSKQIVESALDELQSNTATVCFDGADERVRIVVGVAIFDKIRIPDLHDPDICINDCGQLMPWREHGSSWYPNEAQQYHILQNFADGLRSTWKLEKCNNDVTVVYCKEFNKLQLSAGQGAAKYLTAEKKAMIIQGFMQYMGGQNRTHVHLREGLLFVVANLKETLKSVHVAVIVIATVLSMIAATFVWFLVYAGRYYFEMKILQHNIVSYPWRLLTWLLKVLSGVLLVETLFMIQMRLSKKGRGMVMALVALAVILAAWILLYYVGPRGIALKQAD